MGASREREQIDYYRARAREYEDFWFARGRHALRPPLDAQWVLDTAEAEDATKRWVPTGEVLELACGTGLWTRFLAARAARVTAVDSSPEVIDVNRQRAAGHSVRYVVADVFSWQPPEERFDGVFLGYWHSHVPDERWQSFWDVVRSSLRPGGRVMVVDTPAYPPGAPGDVVARAERRELDDGRQFVVVKRCWEPGQLQEQLTRHGWRVSARTTRNGMILLAELEPA